MRRDTLAAAFPSCQMEGSRMGSVKVYTRAYPVLGVTVRVFQVDVFVYFPRRAPPARAIAGDEVL